MYNSLTPTSAPQVLKEPLVRLLDRKTYWVPQILFSPDSQRLASLSESKVKIWDIATGRHRHTLVGHTTEDVSHIAFSSDGRMLASCSPGNRTITLWDFASGRELRLLRGVEDPTRVAFSPDGQILASGSARGSTTCVTLWNPANGRILRILDQSRSGTEKAWSRVKSLAFSPDGKLVALASTAGVTWWELESGQTLCEFPVELVGFRDAKWSGIDLLAFSSDSMTVLIWDQVSDRIMQRKAGNGSLVKMLRAPTGSYFMDVKHFPNGRQLAVLLGSTVSDAENYNPTRTIVYDDQTLQQIRAIDIETDLYCDFAFSPDGRLMATAECDGTISVWEISSYADSYDHQQL